MRRNTILALCLIVTAVKARDPFSYNQIFTVHLGIPDESVGNGDLEVSVSSLALMGEKDTTAGKGFNIFLHRNEESNHGNDENDDDDDPEDDDGSCSMLSNESLFRTHEPIVTTATYVCKEEQEQRGIHSQRVSSSPTSAALGLRGGGTTSADVLRKLLVVALVTLVYEGLIGTYSI